MIRSLAVLSLLSAISFPAALPQDPHARPESAHERLRKLAGDWSVVTTFVLPGGAPREFQGTAHARTILGGRFLQLDESGTEFGQPSEKQKTFGFNTATKKWESVWMYTGSTAVMHLDGSASADGKTIAGDASYAGADGEPQKFTWELVLSDADHFSTKLITVAPGEGRAATFTAVYTRAPKK
ncbi:MAG: DUF1579 family protein [Planctomycetes bacterium]|nr:DUF1579 family protein [Planctomycetota bacterium]